MKNASSLTLSKMELKNFLIRLGKIFSNLSIFMLVLCLCGILSFIFTGFIFLVGIVIIIVTLGTIFAISPNYFDQLTVAMNVSSSISSFFSNNSLIFAGLTILFAILSIVLLLFDKQTKHKGRIGLSIFILIVALLMILAIAMEVFS